VSSDLSATWRTGKASILDLDEVEDIRKHLDIYTKDKESALKILGVKLLIEAHSGHKLQIVSSRGSRT
jgi:hypothetical protein